MKAYFFLAIICFGLLSCNRNTNKKDETTQVTLHVSTAQGEKALLFKITAKQTLIDSVMVENMDKAINFSLPYNPAGLYKVQLKPSYKNYFFITDGTQINISANNASGNYQTSGSPATQSLINFLQGQKMLADSASISDSQIVAGKNFKQEKLFIESKIRQRAIDFEDTVTNPALFLYVYSTIDFKDDYKSFYSLITKNAKRFTANEQINDLYIQALKTKNIYDKEYNVGDVLPEVTLLNEDGKPYKLSFTGKYTFINIWSAWCTQCMAYNKQLQSVFRNGQSNNVTLINVAMDENIFNWKQTVAANQYNWQQLADTAMWYGNAAQTWAFDSIPYNFLVAAGGKIIAKAIPADSVSIVLNTISSK